MRTALELYRWIEQSLLDANEAAKPHRFTAATRFHKGDVIVEVE